MTTDSSLADAAGGGSMTNRCWKRWKFRVNGELIANRLCSQLLISRNWQSEMSTFFLPPQSIIGGKWYGIWRTKNWTCVYSQPAVGIWEQRCGVVADDMGWHRKDADHYVSVERHLVSFVIFHATCWPLHPACILLTSCLHLVYIFLTS